MAANNRRPGLRPGLSTLAKPRKATGHSMKSPHPTQADWDRISDAAWGKMVELTVDMGPISCACGARPTIEEDTRADWVVTCHDCNNDGCGAQYGVGYEKEHAIYNWNHKRLESLWD